MREIKQIKQIKQNKKNPAKIHSNCLKVYIEILEVLNLL